ncbi:MSCRAMM family protein [Amygdalobacter nucleatus]|uniref:MSCRAMM family protein n=1 Tax=Amygdalobacter nucleatus TaxID=3029274 RepID=UPI00279E7464|nr:SpaA isopeptide-forming pilin-related protein [Amygdalobacter nucleatus]WEG36742.1 SpaA isopeptide-forming pilin-related protein [Amygdalobacter nucleatus]
MKMSRLSRMCALTLAAGIFMTVMPWKNIKAEESTDKDNAEFSAEIKADDEVRADSKINADENITGNDDKLIKSEKNNKRDDSLNDHKTVADKGKEAKLALFSDETERFDLSIGKIVNGKMQAQDEQFYTEQKINSVLHLNVSGNKFKTNNVYLLLKLPNNQYTHNFVMDKSNIGVSSDLQTDKDYKYYKISYSNCKGGLIADYNFSFSFDGHFANDKTSVITQAELYDGDTLVKSTEHTFKAMVLPFEAWSVSDPYFSVSPLFTSSADYKRESCENGHITKYPVYYDKSNENFMAPNLKWNTRLYAALYPKQVGEIIESIGAEYPENLKIVYTFPKLNKGNLSPIPNTGFIGGVENVKDCEWKINGNIAEVLLKHPTFDYLASNVSAFNTNYRKAVCVGPEVQASDIELNKDYRVNIKFYKNITEANSQGELIGERNETLSFTPKGYDREGTFSYRKISEGYGVPNSNSYLSSSNYTYQRGHVYSGFYEISDSQLHYDNSLDDELGGIPMTSFFTNCNNGSGPSSPFEGGDTTKLKAVSSKLCSKDIFYKAVKLDIGSVMQVIVNSENPYNKQNKEKIVNAVNAGTKLIAIKDDGTEQVISTDVKFGEWVKVDDPKIQELRFVFKDYVELDNQMLQMHERLWFKADVINELNDLKQDSPVQEYWSKSSTCLYNEQKPENYILNYDDEERHKNKFSVRAFHPLVDEFINPEQTVKFDQNNLHFEYLIGPKFTSPTNDSRFNYGDLKYIKNVKVITLLPSCFDFDETADDKYTKVSEEFDYNNYSCRSNWGSRNEPNIKFTKITNYKQTGKTAVIADFGDVRVNEKVRRDTYYPIKLKLNYDKFILDRTYEIESYLTYDDNDMIQPENMAYAYTDQLDLNDNKNLTEVFMLKKTNVTISRAQELFLNNGVKLCNDLVEADENTESGSVNGDLGGGVKLIANIVNKSTSDIRTMNVIDVLPYVGDHSICPNKEGKYPSRGSGLNILLTKAIENETENNNEIKEKFNFYYQLDKKYENLASVVDGEWLNANQIKDFTKVKSIKIELKKGQSLKANNEVKIVIPCKIDSSNRKVADSAVAHNSAAFSTGGTYSEANLANIYFSKYCVKGKAFLDLDEDGKYNNKDKLVPGIKVNLLRPSPAASTPSTNAENRSARLDEDRDAGNANIPEGYELAKDLDGNAMTTNTKDNGEYSFDVYQRASYMVQFELGDGQSFCAQSTAGSEKEDTNSIEKPTDNNAKSAVSKQGKLNPSKKEMIRSVAIKQAWKIRIIKVDAKDANKKLAGSEFALLKVQDDKSTKATHKDANGNEFENVTTDDKGEATFKNVPYGSYKVKEIKAPKGYELPKQPETAVPELLAHMNPASVDVTVTNKLNKARLVVLKTDDSKEAKPLAGVEFKLNKIGELKTEANSNPAVTDKQAEKATDKSATGDASDATNSVNTIEKTEWTGTTDKDGKIKFKDLPLGEYRLEETKGLNGYEKLDKPMPITLNTPYDEEKSDDTTKTVPVVNKKIIIPTKPSVPSNPEYVPSTQTEPKKIKVGVVTKTGELANMASGFGLVMLVAFAALTVNKRKK